MKLAIKVKGTTEEEVTSTCAGATKECTGCDPDIPGHVERVFCQTCKGTGREPLSFGATFTELAESRRSAADKAAGRGRKQTDSSDDWLEY